MPVGLELSGDAAHVRLWAPNCRDVQIVIEQHEEGRPIAIPLRPEDDGYFSAVIDGVGPGALYRFRLDSSDRLYPDPASRFQPAGPHGPSMAVDPNRYVWNTADWPGVSRHGHIIYEMHIGTFTAAGTWAAAAERLTQLADIGITLLEVMPVADFAGEFGWGYDGVNLFAPTRLYGPPDSMRAFVDEAHRLGMGVILDVVYNHLGPDGNYLPAFAQGYFSRSKTTDWGEAINFDGPACGPVREFFLANVRYWIEEFRLDGLRLDATQEIHDASEPHILQEIGQAARLAAAGRGTLIIAENEPQHARLARDTKDGGYGLDMLWNDDFHHSAVVTLSGRGEAYYSGYAGSPQEFISVAKHGFLYQGQVYSWQKKRRGSPTRGMDPASFVNFIQNHDQIANSGRGERCHQLAGPALARALTALLYLLPGTPMLFQGQEFDASSPFLFFADHEPELARSVATGRADFLAQFPSLATDPMRSLLDDPADRRTFERCKLDWRERRVHSEAVLLHRDLIALRKTDPLLREPYRVDGAVLGERAFVLRYDSEAASDRLLVVNLGRDLSLSGPPEPLLAPPEDGAWRVLWSSEDPRYGGAGMPPVETEMGWHIAGRSTVLLCAEPPAGAPSG